MKFWIIFLCTALLTGCTQKEQNVMLANPFYTYETMNAAEEASGLQMEIPESVEGIAAKIYRAIPDNLLEVVYTGNVDNVKIRKAAGNEDISGNYSSEIYEEEEAPVASETVLKRLKNGYTYEAIWTSDGFSYSVVSTKPISDETLENLVTTMTKAE